MVIFGNRLFGKVDQVPGVGFVATRFFHIDYVPLIPSQTWLVFQQTGKSWRGIKVPMSFKSIIHAWLRTASVVAGVVGIIGLILDGTGRNTDPMEMAKWIALTVVACGVFAFTKFHKSVTRASYARACQLATLAKSTPATMSALAVAYGQKPVDTLVTTVKPVTPAIDDQPAANADDAIPLDEMDENPTNVEPVPPMPEPNVPRQETRRHG